MRPHMATEDQIAEQMIQELEQNDGFEGQAIDQEKFNKMLKMLMLKQTIREDVRAEMAEAEAAGPTSAGVLASLRKLLSRRGTPMMHTIKVDSTTLLNK